jgi:inorganic triphosphatase YgiF
MELELKLALPSHDPQLLVKQLARCALIGRRTPKRQQLHNVYYDTPEHGLKRMAVALRVRQIDGKGAPHWVQTLKIGGTSDSAFSRRGEWEAPLKTNALDAAMLAHTPWPSMDPDGALLQALSPVFTTDFERLSWVVTLQDAKLEIALDRGQVVMDGHSTPLCELEIELLDGPPEAVFDAAFQIGLHLSLLPLHMSKAERAYRLAAGTLDAPLRAKPPALNKDMSFALVAQTVLRDAFLQFTANLYTLRASDAPEVLHQARIGWRRFKSALKLFKPLATESHVPSLAPLKPLVAQMTQLRDLDVAATEVFPTYAEAYQMGDARQVQSWHAMEEALEHARLQLRAALRQSLADPSVGRTLLLVTRWIETEDFQAPRGKTKGKTKHRVTHWVQKRMAHVADLARAISPHATDPAQQHQLRILHKRLRYGVESLHPLLPAKRAERWLQMAIQSQTQIGLERDRLQAVAIARQLRAADGVVQFLRGAAFAANGLGLKAYSTAIAQCPEAFERHGTR